MRRMVSRAVVNIVLLSSALVFVDGVGGWVVAYSETTHSTSAPTPMQDRSSPCCCCSLVLLIRVGVVGVGVGKGTMEGGRGDTRWGMPAFGNDRGGGGVCIIRDRMMGGVMVCACVVNEYMDKSCDGWGWEPQI